jgi:hypothetical protein
MYNMWSYRDSTGDEWTLADVESENEKRKNIGNE